MCTSERGLGAVYVFCSSLPSPSVILQKHLLFFWDIHKTGPLVNVLLVLFEMYFIVHEYDAHHALRGHTFVDILAY